MSSGSDVFIWVIVIIFVFAISLFCSYCKYQMKKEKKKRLQAEIAENLRSAFRAEAVQNSRMNIANNNSRNNYQIYSVERRYEQEIRRQNQELAQLRVQNQVLINQQQASTSNLHHSSTTLPSAPPTQSISAESDKPPMYSEVVREAENV